MPPAGRFSTPIRSRIRPYSSAVRPAISSVVTTAMGWLPLLERARDQGCRWRRAPCSSATERLYDKACGCRAGEVLLPGDQIAVAYGKVAPQPRLDIVSTQRAQL